MTEIYSNMRAILNVDISCGYLGTVAKGGIKNKRDQIRFGSMIFSRLALGVGAGSIEISQ